MNEAGNDIKRAAGSENLCRRVEEIYEEADRRIGQSDVSCRQCGGCCRFEESEQNLMASTLEAGYLLAWLREQDGEVLKALSVGTDSTARVCPFLAEDVCLAREGRSLGCRVFFCQAERQGPERMAEVYELLHEQLKILHGQAEISYRYFAWEEVIQAVKELLQANQVKS